MISVTATVLRNGAPHEVAVAKLVPGDVVQLTAGDMIPGDVRIVQAKDLFVSQGALTGESFPVEKCELEKHAAAAATAPITLTSIAFLGTSVESGAARARTLTWAAWRSPFRSNSRPPHLIAGSPGSPGSCFASCW
jgi:Mg2+-importing ATPase